MLRFDYSNMFPIDVPSAMREIAVFSNSKAVKSHCSFVGLAIHFGRMTDQILRHTSLNVLLAVESPIR